MARWIRIQALLWSALLAATAWFAWADRPGTPMTATLGIASVLSFVSLWLVLGAGRTVADFVTAARFVLLAASWGAVAVFGFSWLAWALLVVIVLSDLADGWCARRWGATAEGAILDMETDQLVTIALAAFAVLALEGAVWLLLLPAFRYAYLFYLFALGLPAHDPKPREGDNRQARLICAAVMVLLLACNLPALTPLWRALAGGAAVIALAYSFGSDAVYLFRRRGAKAAG